MYPHPSFSSNSHDLFCCSSFSLRNASVLTHSRKYPLASCSLLQLSSMIIMSLVRAQFVFGDFFPPQVKCPLLVQLSEPLAGIQCTKFYSAPKRSKFVSRLCSEDVCQCAESTPWLLKKKNQTPGWPSFRFRSKIFQFFLGPCHKLQNTFQSRSGRYIRKSDRMEHACFVPTVDYGQYPEI